MTKLAPARTGCAWNCSVVLQKQPERNTHQYTTENTFLYRFNYNLCAFMFRLEAKFRHYDRVRLFHTTDTDGNAERDE